MKELYYVVVSILTLLIIIMLINFNSRKLYGNCQMEHHYNESVDFYGNNFFGIEVDGNDKIIKIINAESIYKKIDNKVVEIKNPNIIINSDKK